MLVNVVLRYRESARTSSSNWLLNGLGSWLSSSRHWLFLLGLRLELLLLALKEADDVAWGTTRPGAALAGLLALLSGDLSRGLGFDAFLWGCVCGLGGANWRDDCSGRLCKRKKCGLAAATRKSITT
jgi:hypothetical protein